MFKKSSVGRLFSKPVFTMTFKKTLPQGILFLLAGVLLPVYAMWRISENEMSPGRFYIFIKFFLMAVALLAPFFVFPAFSHLFSKRKSDLMESLPESRASFACSALLACMLWMTVIGLCTLFSCLLAPIFLREYAFSQLFEGQHAVVSPLLAALLVPYLLALSFLAVSLCGRLEGAILMLLVLLFAPGLLALSVESTFFDAAGSQAPSPLFFVGVPLWRLIMSEIEPDFRLTALQLFTALLEILLCFFAAAFFFIRRKSEKSGVLTLHPLLSRLMVSLLTLLPFLISLLFFSNEYSGHGQATSLGAVAADLIDYMSKGLYLYLFAASLIAFPVCVLLIERRAVGVWKALLTHAAVVSALVLLIFSFVMIHYLWG